MKMANSNNLVMSILGAGAVGVAIAYAASKSTKVRRFLVRCGICNSNPMADALEPQMRKVAKAMGSINILSVDDLSNQQIICLMELANFFKEKVSQKEDCQVLSNNIMVTLFMEPSTRTRCSFEAAMLRLGGKVISIADASTSSTAKGESEEDSVKVLSSYADVVVMRHSEKGIMERIKEHVKVPLINAGDGQGEHPSQALLDLYTILTYFPIMETNNERAFTICFVGDLKNGRTAHSLAKLLSRYNVVMRYVAPTQLQMPTEIQREVENNFAKYNIPDLPLSRQTSFSQLEDACEGADVIYVTRLQKERMDSQGAKGLLGSYGIQKTLLPKLMKHVKIMHPLPRIDELPPEIDNDERAIYFEQAQNGLYVRMAMLYLILNSKR